MTDFDTSRFAEWREHLQGQIRQGNPYVGYQPRVADVLAMMDYIERRPGFWQTAARVLLVFLGSTPILVLIVLALGHWLR